MTRGILIAALLMFCSVLCQGGDEDLAVCPVVHIVPERLPDLNTPRTGHNIFYANGELTVLGGHTTNFIPTPTAEYYADGEWHLIPMAYSHDNGFAVVMRSGEVIAGGGHDEPLGIGQTFMLERYNPAMHTFEGFGCLDRRRTLANATQLADGRVIIAGNHYAEDAIACYDGHSQVQQVNSVAQGYDCPYILHTAKDNAIVIGWYDTYAKPLGTILAYQVKGDAFRVPLLEQWHLVYQDQPFNSDASFIGDEQKGDYSYLLPATDDSGQLAIILVSNSLNDQSPNSPSDQTPSFTLLPTASPIPMRSPFGPIAYKTPVVVDRQRQRAYVVGTDSLISRQYILAIDISLRPSALTLYHTAPMEHATYTMPVLTPDGDLILAGGMADNNYKPLASVWLYRFGTAGRASSPTFNASGTDFPAASGLLQRWTWAVAVIVAVFFLVYIIIYIRRKGYSQTVASLERTDTEPPVPANSTSDVPADDTGYVSADDSKAVQLMENICRLMDVEHLYLRSDLKLQDVAVRINTNSTYVSECINSVSGQTFSQFVNAYRVRHAQELLSQRPDIKAAAVASESGFNTEASFFRNFKAVTGMTPREWINSQSDSYKG